MRINLQAIKERPALALISGAMLVGTPRYVDAFANAAGFRVVSPAWDAIHAASGFGMAVLEALAIWYVAAMLSRHGRRNVASSALLALLSMTFLSLGVIVTPTIMATAQRVLVVDLLDRTGLWIWSTALMLAPLLVMASSGIAEHLATPHEIPATDNVPPVKGVTMVDKPLTLREAIQCNPGASVSMLAELTGTSRQNVSQKLRRLEAAGNIRRNGKIEFTESV